MGDRSAIEWTDASWNPVVGCSVVSPGCTNCYAMRQAARIERMQPGSHYAGTVLPSKAGPVWTGKLALAPEHILTQPLRWRRPRRIFVNSMGDLFHESVPDEWIDRVFAVMALTPQHTYQVLTKRSARMREYVGTRAGDWMLHWPDAARKAGALLGDMATIKSLRLPLPNVWLGVSTEDQRRADERVPDLLATPAAIRFVSAEPLLGPIRFSGVSEDGQRRWNWLTGETGVMYPDGPDFDHGPKLDQIIVGGESGPNARPMHPDWARSLRDQCTAAGVAFFFKQWGTWAPRRVATSSDLLDARRSLIVSPNGNVTSGLMAYPANAWVMDRVGKKTAGRLLDGVEHNAMPEVRP